MTPEEKSSAYDKALALMQDCIPDENGLVHVRPEEIFPELRESEDEKIRKEIMYHIQHCDDTIDKETEERMIAWFEKQQKASKVEAAMRDLEQKAKAFTEAHKGETSDEILAQMRGEQKPANKVEHNFKVNDWAVNNDSGVIQHIKEIVNVNDETLYVFDEDKVLDINFQEQYHLWTIQDAKDGDVLIASDESIFIYSGSTYRYAKFYVALTKYGRLNINGGNWEYKNSILHPATEEQRDLLFSKMKEAGYEWDADKKELKKIEDEEYNGEDYGIDSLWHAKNILEKTLGEVDGYQSDDGILDHKAAITAVKKLYEKKPTLEDAAKAFLQALSDTPYNNTPVVDAQIITKQLLTFMSDRKAYDPDAINKHKSAEWSEEDEKMVIALMSICDEWATRHSYLPKENNDIEKIKRWLKSLRPQKQWKPSDEQLYFLHWLATNVLTHGEVEKKASEVLESLYNNLKKLKGE